MATTRRNFFLHLSMFGLLLAGNPPASAQEADGFWDKDRRKEAAAAAVQMITQPDPYMMALVRMRAKNFGIWHEPVYNVSLGAPQLDPARLALIKDRTSMPNFRDRDPKSRSKVEQATYDLYCLALRYCKDVPLEAFEKSAEGNETVTWGHLYRESTQNDKRETVNRYRGKVIPIEGHLLRLRRDEAPRALQEHGIRYVYEGWIKGPTTDAPAFWVVMPNQPETRDGLLEPAEQMNLPVKFYGYFFKLLPFPAPVGSDGQAKTGPFNTPLLLGPTLIVTGPAPTPPENLNVAPVSSEVLTILAVFGTFAVVVLITLAWWFRRGDRQFRERVHRYHQTLEVLGNNLAEGETMKPENGTATDRGLELTGEDKPGPELS